MSGGRSVGKALRSGGRRREGRVTGFREAESVRAEGQQVPGPRWPAPSPVRNRVGRGEGQMTLDLLSPWKDLGFPKESWNGLGGFSAEKHHDVTYIFLKLW